MTLAEYQADVKKRGWLYLPQLPPNTPLGKKVEGSPGARSPWSATGSMYEVAPLAVRLAEGFTRDISALVGTVEAYAIANPLGLSTLDDDATGFTKGADVGRNVLAKAAESVGLDHGVGGLVAKAIGIQPWILLLFVGAAAYLYFRKVT